MAALVGIRPFVVEERLPHLTTIVTKDIMPDILDNFFKTSPILKFVETHRGLTPQNPRLIAPWRS